MDVSYHITQYTNIINDLREEIRRLRDKLDDAASRDGSLNDPTVGGAMGGGRGVGGGGGRGGGRHDTQLNNLKESLVNIFHHQMDLRRSLMELNTTAMEISLETTRNQLLIKK